MDQAPPSLRLCFRYFTAIACVCILLLLDGINPAHAEDPYTVNLSVNRGLFGGLLATPPGSCTAVPNGAFGDCSTRAGAALDAWVNGKFWAGTDWSDLREASVPAPIAASDPPKPLIDIGTSWIPKYCDRPSCGHLLKGEVQFIDENGDGKIDNTWIDDGDGIRENGEVDRLRADQFAWGATSLTVDPSRLGDPLEPQMLFGGGTSPPGMSRARVRASLGDNPECDSVISIDCHLSTGGSGTIAKPGDIPDDVDGFGNPNNPNDLTTFVDNNGFYGLCDPDRFTGDLISIQHQLDNCLWKVGSTPVTAPMNASATLQGNAVRNSWISQVLVKYTASDTPDRQNFDQLWRVHYGFEETEIDPDTLLPVFVKTESAIYNNQWFIHQTDIDPNPAVNLNGDTLDTYLYGFFVEHESRVRRYGHDFTGVKITEPGLITDWQDRKLTNPTDDPFWVADDEPGDPFEVPHGDPLDPEFFDKDFTTDAESGVGQRTGFRFLYTQDVEGLFLSCLDCGPSHLIVPVPDMPSYQFSYVPLPELTLPASHPPASGTIP